MPRRFWFCKKCQAIDFVTQNEYDTEETLVCRVKEVHSTKNLPCVGDVIVLERWVVQAIAKNVLQELEARFQESGCIKKGE